MFFVFVFVFFLLFFCRIREKNVIKCVPHVQLDNHSSVNQLYYRFLTLPLPSSLLQLPNREHRRI